MARKGADRAKMEGPPEAGRAETRRGRTRERPLGGRKSRAARKTRGVPPPHARAVPHRLRRRPAPPLGSKPRKPLARPTAPPPRGALHATRRLASGRQQGDTPPRPGRRTHDLGGSLQPREPLTHRPPSGTLPGGGSQQPRPGPHARGPLAGCGSGRERAASHSQRARGKRDESLIPSTRDRSPAAHTDAAPRAHTRHRPPPHARRPGQAQRDPPPTRRGEAQAAVGERAGARPPPAGGRRTPSLPTFPHRRSARKGGTLAYG